MDNISFKKLAKLGLLDIVKRELKKEEILKDLDSPPEDIKINLIKDWCKIKKINSDQKLKSWMNKYKLEQKELEDLITKDWKWCRWCLKEFKDDLSSYYLEKKENLIPFYIY